MSKLPRPDGHPSSLPSPTVENDATQARTIRPRRSPRLATRKEAPAGSSHLVPVKPNSQAVGCKVMPSAGRQGPSLAKAASIVASPARNGISMPTTPKSSVSKSRRVVQLGEALKTPATPSRIPRRRRDASTGSNSGSVSPSPSPSPRYAGPAQTPPETETEMQNSKSTSPTAAPSGPGLRPPGADVLGQSLLAAYDGRPSQPTESKALDSRVHCVVCCARGLVRTRASKHVRPVPPREYPSPPRTPPGTERGCS